MLLQWRAHLCPGLCVAAGVRCCVQVPFPFRLLSWNLNDEQPEGGRMFVASRDG